MSRFSIRAFVGPNGSGKTLAMIEKVAIPMWEKGRPVSANLALRPEALGFDRDLFQPLTSWRQIPTLRGCALLLDEISSVAPARQSGSMPSQLVRILEQLRKQDTICAWTAPRWEACDVALRRCTQAVTICKGLVPDRWQREADPAKRVWAPRRLRGEDGRPLRIEQGWLPNRLHIMTTYDAISFDDAVTNAKADTLKPEGRERYWRSKHRAMHAYSTLEQVEMLDHLDDVGVCVICGGSRTRPKCSCHPGTPRAAAGGEGVPAMNGGRVGGPR